MAETWIMIALGGLFALVLARSAIIAVWPESDAARVCEHRLGVMDSAGASDREDGDCGGGDGGGGD